MIRLLKLWLMDVAILLRDAHCRIRVRLMSPEQRRRRSWLALARLRADGTLPAAFVDEIAELLLDVEHAERAAL